MSGLSRRAVRVLPRTRPIILVLALLLAFFAHSLSAGAKRASHRGKHTSHWLVLNHPIDPAQELDLPFGTRSQWLQPWRGYLDTPPARTINEGLGINFNVTAQQAWATAAALERAGFRRARVEIGWDNINPADTSELTPYEASQWQTILGALFAHHIRPLILLNANEGEPTATTFLNLGVLVPALAGTRTVVLSPASAAQVIPGHTGFNSLTGGYEAAAVIVTSIQGDVATLSAPLPKTLLPGDYSAATIAFAPFTDPKSPGFAQTLAGWLSYVQTVGDFARSVGKGKGFDMEVWNELSFGSDFLNINNYYSPPVDPQAPASGSDPATDEALLTATASLIHKDFPGTQVGDGFSDETPWTSGQTEVPGVQIDKHYYNGMYVYPQDNGPSAVRPVDWLGRTFATYSKVNGSDDWSDYWVPSYIAYFPEFWLSGLYTETLIRDLTPLSGENIYGAPHGRYTHPPGAPAPQVWMTEYNLDQDQPQSPVFTPIQEQRFQAKVALRYLLAFINKGLGMVDFYSAEGGLGLIPNSFFSEIGERRKPDPGLTLAALGRMTSHLQSASHMRRRSIKLLRISTTDHRNVFNGSGPYPPLRNLDVTAFFPFQEATHRFVFAAYVMTRNLAQAWQKPGPHEYDMPAGLYRFEIGNVDGCATSLSAYDPLNARSVPVRRIACTAHTLTLQTKLTDSPILIQANGA